MNAIPRRHLLGLAAGIGGAGLLAACGGGGETGGGGSTPGGGSTNGGGGGGGAAATVNFWSYYEATGRGSAFGSLADQYMADNPNVTINLNLAPSNFNTVLRTAMMGNDRPEFLGITQYNMRDFAAAGLLAPLDDVLTEAGIADDIFPAAIEAATLDGTLYGIADALRFGMWFYNPEAFDALGVDQPATYDDLVEVSGRIRAEGKYPMLLGLSDVNTATNSFQVFVPAFIGLTEMLRASEAKDYTSQPFVDALSMYKRMVDDGVMDAADTGMTATDAHAMLATGEAVMLPGASYSIGTLLALNPDMKAFDEPVELLDNPVAKYWGGAGQMYCVSADTEFQAEATELLKWWVQPEQFKVQVEESGLVSSLRSANEAIPNDGLSEFAAANLETVDPEGLFFNNYIPSNEAEAWGRAIQEVVSGSKTPEQAIETTVQAAFDA